MLGPLQGDLAGPPVQVASGLLGSSLPRLASNGERYLAVFNDASLCRITCAPDQQPYGRMFALDGTPLTEARLLTRGVGWNPDVVSDGDDFFVVWQKTLVKVGPDFTIGPEHTLARAGHLSLEGAELRIDSGITRAAYSLSGELLRFEPLRIQAGERFEAALSGARIVVGAPAHPPRLFIRSLDNPPAPAADLAVVATGGISLRSPWGYSSDAKATFRIEHRGGAPVRRIELWADEIITLPGQLYGSGSYHLLDRELREGESFEVSVRVYPNTPSQANPRLWVAGDARDENVVNNVDRYERPVRQRGRAVGR